jgi:transposase
MSKRNKTDAADAGALLEAARASDMKAVRIKSVEQQALQALHRTRSAWLTTRTQRINALRSFCREFGLVVPAGAATGIAQLERELAEMAAASPACQALLSVPGIGLITSTAMVAAIGDARSFDSARRYASFLGLTPREHSSGERRVFGGISKRGDRYLRMLLTHGARSVLRAATVARPARREIDRLKTWALEVQSRTNHNKAACALANKLARIAWAVWMKHEKYQAAAIPAGAA